MNDPPSNIKLLELQVNAINNNQQNSTNANHDHQQQQQQQLILEQERFMPIANISRIMKRVLPERAKLSKESKECIQECLTEFFLFVTSEAAEKCSTEKRKTITGEDLLAAMEELGFENNFLLPLKVFLKRYKEANRSTKENNDGESGTENNVSNVPRQNLSHISPPSQSSKNDQQANPKLNSINTQQQQSLQQPLHQPQQQPQPQQQQQEDNDAEDILEYLPSNFRRAKEIYVDTVTQQYYIFATLPDGTKGLLPIQLQPMMNNN